MATRRVDIRINVDDLDAGKRLDDIAAKLDKLSKGTFTIKLRLDDGGTAAKLDKIAAKLDKIGSNTYTPKIGLDDTKAVAELDDFNAKLDKIGHKRVTATVHVKTTGGSGIGSDLSRLLGGAGGGGGGNLAKDAEAAGASGAGGGAGGFLSFLGGANNSYMGILIGGLVALAASVTPALLPFGIGTGVGLGGAFAASKLGTTGISKLQADRQALARAQAAIRGATAPGTASASQMLALHQAQQQLSAAKTPAQRAAAQAAIARAQASISGSTAPGTASALQRLTLRQAQAQLGRDQSKYGGFVPFGHAVKNVGNTALDTLLGALTSDASKPHGGTAPGTSFLAGLTPIITQFGAFIKQIGPSLGEIFRASIPFISAFAKIMEQSGKIILPAFLQSMKSITPFLPQIVKGFVILAQGVADFIKDLGPGMKDSVTVFLGLMTMTKGILIGLAYAADYAAKFLANFGHVMTDIGRFIHEWWDKLEALDTKQRHRIAVVFDDIRHTIASAWDEIWNNTIGRFERGYQDVMNWEDNLRHGIANKFDAIRQGIAQAWNTIWTNTVNAVSRGYHTVLTWFDRFPGSIKSALGNLGSMLMTIGKNALNDFWSGLKSVGSSVLGWIKTFFTGIPKAIMSFLHMSPPHPGSAFFDLGSNFMHHLEAGMKSRVGSIKGVSGHIGGSVNGWILESLKLAGKPLSWLPALQRLVSLESGGNPRAVDPISVGGQHAQGLWQMLPSTFFGEGGRGSLFNPITEGIAALRYISSRYGSPFNIPGLFGGGYQGYRSGGIITEPIFGLGMSGKAYTFGEGGIHERVTPLGSGGGAGGNIYISVAGDSDPDGAALRIIQRLRKYKQHHGNAALGIG